jgi:hypothetical protein
VNTGISRNTSGRDLCRRSFVIVVMLVWQWVQFLLGGINSLAPEIQPPVDKRAVVLIEVRILDDDRPGANALFAPVKP